MKTYEKKNLGRLILNLSLPLLYGAASALINMGSFDAYEQLNQPHFSPPSWVFPIVWTILYILMGISAYIVSDKGTEFPKRPLTVYIIQLVMNFIWPLLFFTFKAYFLSFIWLAVLSAIVIVMAVIFCRINKTAGLLQIPYIIWTIYAIYLNLGVYLLN
ncbi:MAG: tryptophan-rich sensory protein [Clostridia bacterium]|nr:tryptophan-rich sensory protein [Clostridia bacterium]